MFKQTITYTDFNDVERTEDFYFNLTKAEITKMNLSQSGGLIALLTKMTQTQDVPSIVSMFEEIVLSSYGEPTLDGRGFSKSEAITKAFTQTEAYSQFYMDLMTDSEVASAFIKGIVPKDIAKQIDVEMSKEQA